MKIPTEDSNSSSSSSDKFIHMTTLALNNKELIKKNDKISPKSHEHSDKHVPSEGSSSSSSDELVHITKKFLFSNRPRQQEPIRNELKNL